MMNFEEMLKFMIEHNVSAFYLIAFTSGIFWSTILDFVLSLISKILDKIFKDKDKKEDDKNEKS